MNIKQFIKPNIFKIFVFLPMAFIFLYLAKEDICGAGFLFAFCYRSYGFPFSYMATGNVDAALGHIKTLFLGEHFNKLDNVLINPIALLFDLAFIYLLSCIIFALSRNIKPKK